MNLRCPVILLGELETSIDERGAGLLIGAGYLMRAGCVTGSAFAVGFNCGE
jgi:hypothetical protein